MPEDSLIYILTETLALVSGTIDKDFAADHVAEGKKHLHELGISKFLGQVVNEEVTALRAGNGAAWEHQKFFKELTNLLSNTNVLYFVNV